MIGKRFSNGGDVPAPNMEVPAPVARDLVIGDA
ncbi:hypothetical protein W911_08865 [Hyphomicrobium nitrativorans NL23]|uniref:Uncharacterized protein n=1 Tax=Hyphomicrobium nitrativorans NL23 TaxID=1029756 RepID=V5SJ63_9HYPH|nr:hypothetical protein W911_08865 [Hyphomicrobium nitrativorans NL23]